MYYFHGYGDRNPAWAKRYTLEESLSYEILPYFGTLPRKVGADSKNSKIVALPKGIGAYQQIMLDATLFNKGQRPAVDVGLSVSRVGSSAQVKAMKQVSGGMKLDLAQFREVEAFAQFGSDLDAATQKLLNRGSKLTELLKQKQYSPMTVAEQVISVFCGVKGHLDEIEQKDIATFETKIIEKCRSEKPEIIDSINSSGKLDEDNEKVLTELISDLKKTFNS